MLPARVWMGLREQARMVKPQRQAAELLLPQGHRASWSALHHSRARWSQGEMQPSFKLALLAKPSQETADSEACLMQPWVLVPRAQSCNSYRQKGQDGPREGKQPSTTHRTHTRSLLQAIMDLKEVYRLHLELQPTRFA